MTVVRWSSRFDCGPEELFAFHMDAANLDRISPPIPPMRLVSPPDETRPGAVQEFRIGWGPLGTTWVARVTRVVDGRLLEDMQERGPFRRWRHQHRIGGTPGAATLPDVVSFRFIPTPVGEFAEWLLVRPLIVGMFAFRHGRTRRLVGRSG